MLLGKQLKGARSRQAHSPRRNILAVALSVINLATAELRNLRQAKPQEKQRAKYLVK